MLLHDPVMLQETLDHLPEKAKLIVDGTLGHGGHTLAIAQYYEQKGQDPKIIGIDVDTQMAQKAIERTKSFPNVHIVHNSYAKIKNIVQDEKIDFVLLDLGVNMEHFKDAKRGFSIKNDAQLDMRFDTKKGSSAYEFINQANSSELSQAFQNYAEFSQEKSDEIAKHLCKTRKNKKIETTHELKSLLKECGLGEKACAVIFQAIRIEVNQELNNLKKFLEDIPACMAPKGIIAIMTYHSLEDRIVKQTFKTMHNTTSRSLIHKKAIQPHYLEVQKNKAARSAKFRFIQKVA